MTHQFEIIREEKVVAEGCIFSSGSVVVAWLGDTPSVVIHKDIQNVIKVHGHEGTRIESVARLEQEKVNNLLNNRAQDRCENINVEFSPSSNAAYVWNERDKILDMLERRPINPITRDGGPKKT